MQRYVNHLLWHSTAECVGTCAVQSGHVSIFGWTKLRLVSRYRASFDKEKEFIHSSIAKAVCFEDWLKSTSPL